MITAFLFAQVVWLVEPAPQLAPPSVCKCGEQCPCKPKPVVSVVKPPLPAKPASQVECINGQCFPQIAPRAIVAKPITPATKSVALPQLPWHSCPNGQCVQAPPASSPANVKPKAGVSPGLSAACPQCQPRSYSQPVRRVFRRW